MQNLLQRLQSWGPDASLDTHIKSLDQLWRLWQLWPLWPYCHSGHSDIDVALPLILVSKEASWPKEYSLWRRFCLNNYFEGQKLKNCAEIFVLYKFWKSFVFLVNKQRFWGSTSHYPSALKFMFLESVGTTEQEKNTGKEQWPPAAHVERNLGNLTLIY